MTASESRRHDLYNVLSETIGPEEADTLMAYLPSRESSDLATRADVFALGARMDRLESGVDAVNRRLDRLFLTVAAGLVAMIATVFAQALL